MQHTHTHAHTHTHTHTQSPLMQSSDMARIWYKEGSKCARVCMCVCVCVTQADGVDALQGITLGPRLLLGLAAAIECVAGQEAVGKLNVIIHCSESQVRAMCVCVCVSG